MDDIKKDQLIIFDTTLRDGEQCPGASMTLKEKLTIAKALEELRVDVIEAGFAVSSKGDFESVKSIAKEIKNTTICSLARAVANDIDVAYEALRFADSYRIHTFIATSPIHMQHKLKLSPEDVLDKAVLAVKHARKYTDNVEFSCEDAGRSELDFLCRISEAVIKVGARTINLPDTVGYTTPHEYGNLIKSVIENVANSDKAIFSTHCHNDLGLAVANSLHGVLNNARQVECTINGIGERAGNAALEEIVMAVKTRSDVFKCKTNIDTGNLVKCSELVSKITGFNVPPNKAIVGLNAFAHEAGIHQDGVLKYRQTYEIMKAADVGWKSNGLVLGKHSGKNAFKSKLLDLNIIVDSEQILHAAFDAFKNLADVKKIVKDSEIIEIVEKIQTKYL